MIETCEMPEADNLNAQEDAIKCDPELHHCPCGNMTLDGHSKPGARLQEHTHTYLESIRTRGDLVNLPSL